MSTSTETRYSLMRKKFDYQGKADLAEAQGDKEEYIKQRALALKYKRLHDMACGGDDILKGKTDQEREALYRKTAESETRYSSFGEAYRKPTPPVHKKKLASMQFSTPASKPAPSKKSPTRKAPSGPAASTAKKTAAKPKSTKKEKK